ncbi:unnamed protein product [Adineta steineri]|uniref:Uncharacterized protein n=2 Tax=Adineta steineri TaxID=433720 RepID=A0A819VFK5_9BILA|nr:unnamed protein product [Adineta steineri]
MPFTIYVYGVNENRFLFRSMFLLILVAGVQFYHVFFLRDIQRSVFIFREPNVTDISWDMYISIPYEDCRCNVISIESCLTNLQIKYTRILPLILFLLEVYTFKDILSLHRYRSHFIVNFYWIVSIFLFFCLVTVIYRCSSYYDIINIILADLGILLYLTCGATQIIP